MSFSEPSLEAVGPHTCVVQPCCSAHFAIRSSATRPPFLNVNIAPNPACPLSDPSNTIREPNRFLMSKLVLKRARMIQTIRLPCRNPLGSADRPTSNSSWLRFLRSGMAVPVLDLSASGQRHAIAPIRPIRTQFASPSNRIRLPQGTSCSILNTPASNARIVL